MKGSSFSPIGSRAVRMWPQKCLPPSSAHLVENSERMRQCNWTKEPRFGGKESEKDRNYHGVFHGFSRPCTNSAHTLPHLRGPQIGLSSNSWPHSTRVAYTGNLSVSSTPQSPFSLIFPLKSLVTSVQTEVGVSSHWTLFPVIIIYYWLKYVLTTLTRVWLCLSLSCFFFI